MNIKALNKLLLVIEEFRIIDPQLPQQMAAVLIYVCGHNGCSVKDIENGLGMSQSSASRNAAALSSTHRSGKNGFELIQEQTDFEDARRKLLFLTPQGKRIAETLSHLMES